MHLCSQASLHSVHEHFLMHPGHVAKACPENGSFLSGSCTNTQFVLVLGRFNKQLVSLLYLDNDLEFLAQRQQFWPKKQKDKKKRKRIESRCLPAIFILLVFYSNVDVPMHIFLKYYHLIVWYYDFYIKTIVNYHPFSF